MIGEQMNSSFSKWPGAWERHLIRQHDSPQYFEGNTRPTAADIADAQARDQKELALFHSSLESLIARCVEITDDTNAETINSIKTELDACHYTAFGLATDLTEQKTAIAALSDLITAAMQRTLDEKDETTRLRLMQKEATRMEQLHRLEYPIVCDLLRTVSPIPRGEVTGALLAEPDSAYKAVLEILPKDRKATVAQRIDTIIENLDSERHKAQALRKLEILNRQLLAKPATKTATDKPATV